MPLDHYVSQVHLKNFYASSLDGKKMYATRKRDLQQFPCGSRDVCRVFDGSTNLYIEEPRKIEDFLKEIEPLYTKSCEAFYNGNPKTKDIYSIAGFVAYVVGCSPTAMRLGSIPLTKLVRYEAELMERAGLIDDAPPELGSKSLTQLLDEGSVIVDTDQKFPQSLGINGILAQTNLFGNSEWEVLVNPVADKSPFLSSDFPVAVEDGIGPVQRKIIPLRPDLAVRILPNPDITRQPLNFEFPQFRFKTSILSRSAIRVVNQAIVRSAENLIFHSTNEDWINPFIKRNAIYRLDIEHHAERRGTGWFIQNRVVYKKSGDE